MASDVSRDGFFSRVWGYLKWHKGKFLFLGSVTALGVGGYYYAKRMIMDGMRQVEELGRGLQEKMMEGQHRANELGRVREECARMIQTFVPPLRGTVKQLTDPKPVTERLKTVRSLQKAAGQVSNEEAEELNNLWDELKVISLTRLIASLYALGLLNALLRIQLHVLGRNAFEEAAQHRKQLQQKRKQEGKEIRDIEQGLPEAESEPSKVTRKVRERFLFSGSDHLMNTGNGMRVLVERVRQGIDRASKDWLMGTNTTVTRQQVNDKLDMIRAEIEKGSAGSSAEALNLPEETRAWLTQCLIPTDEESLLGPDRELDDEQNRFVREMLEETLDMVESPSFALGLQTSFDRLFQVLKSDILSRPFEAYNAPGEQSENKDEVFLLPKVIVSLKLVAGDLLSEGGTTANALVAATAEGVVDTSNAYERALCAVPALDELCAAVFQQGADTGQSNDGLDALGLGDLGLGDEDLQSLAGLLGSLGGAGVQGGMPNEAELMRMLGGDLGGPGNRSPGAPGDPNLDLMSMLRRQPAS